MGRQCRPFSHSLGVYWRLQVSKLVALFEMVISNVTSPPLQTPPLSHSWRIQSDIHYKNERNYTKMKNKENKIRIAAWIDPDSVKKMENYMADENVDNQSQFINKAVSFYLSYLSSKDSTEFLSDVLLGAIDGTINQCERRISNNIFRLAVEESIMMNLLSCHMDVPEEAVERTRARCMKSVLEMDNQIRYEDALMHQKGV